MWNRRSWLPGLVLCAASCTSGPGDTAATGPTVQASGHVEDAVFGNNVPGASVCSVWNECVSSDGDGRFVHPGVPGEAQTHVQVSSEGATPVLAAFETTADPIELTPVGLSESSFVDSFYFLLDTEREPGTGIVAFRVTGDMGGQAGIRARLQPTANGPHYTNDNGLPETDRFETGRDGGGMFINVEPGTVELEHIGLPEGCQTLLGWGSADRVSVPVEADAVTLVRVGCSPAGR